MNETRQFPQNLVPSLLTSLYNMRFPSCKIISVPCPGLVSCLSADSSRQRLFSDPSVYASLSFAHPFPQLPTLIHPSSVHPPPPFGPCSFPSTITMLMCKDVPGPDSQQGFVESISPLRRASKILAPCFYPPFFKRNWTPYEVFLFPSRIETLSYQFGPTLRKSPREKVALQAANFSSGRPLFFFPRPVHKTGSNRASAAPGHRGPFRPPALVFFPAARDLEDTFYFELMFFLDDSHSIRHKTL